MKNKMIHRLLSISLSTVMIFSSLGINVYAAETAATDDALSSASENSDNEEAVSFSKDNNTLSLNRFDSDTGITVSADRDLSLGSSNESRAVRIDTGSSTLSSGIYSDGDITIDLSGDNTVSFDADCGIAANGDIEFTGSGTLTIENSDIGILALDGTISVNGPEIKIIDGKADANDLFVNSGSITAQNIHDQKLDKETSDDSNTDEECSLTAAKEDAGEAVSASTEENAEKAATLSTEENAVEASSASTEENAVEADSASTEENAEEAGTLSTEESAVEADSAAAEDTSEKSDMNSSKEDAGEAESASTEESAEEVGTLSTEESAVEASTLSTEEDAGEADDDIFSLEALEIRDISASLDKPSLTLYSGGDTGRLTCSFPVSDHVTSWSCENPSILTITGDGDSCTINTLDISEDLVQTKVTATVSYTYSDESTKECRAECIVTVKKNDMDDLPDKKPLGSGIYYTTDLSDEDYCNEQLVYDGTKKTPSVKVYDFNRLLTYGTDYTVTYKNNIKAADKNSKTAPSLTITLKGRYSGTVTERFTISPADISGDGFEKVKDITVQYNKKQQMPAPTVIFKGKSLKYGSDFYVQDYQDVKDRKDKTTFVGSSEGNTSYTLTIVGKGNFKGSRTVNYTIAGLRSTESTPQVLMSKVSVSAIANVQYTGESFIYEDLKDKKGLPIAVTYKGTVLTEGTDFSSEVINNTEIGTASVILTGTGGSSATGYSFIGTKTVTFKITGTSISSAAITEAGDKYHPYAGIEIKPSFTVKFKGEILNEGQDYRLTTAKGNDYRSDTTGLEDYTHPGTKTVIVQGIGKYYGTKKVTYRISSTKVDFGNEELFRITSLDGQSDISAEYSKGGAKPEILVTYYGSGSPETLKEGRDYTIRYSNNTAISTLSKKPATITVTGKGSFTGSSSKTFTITPRDIGKVRIYAADVAKSTKPGRYTAKLTLTDTDGKVLKAGTDYDTAFKYSAKDMSDLDIKQAGGDIPIIYVTVNGKNNYEGSITGSYRIYDTAQTVSLSKLLAYADTMTYTGNAIEPLLASSEDVNGIHLYKSSADRKNHICVDDPENYVKIISYSSNINVGTAKVTLLGIGKYYGTKTVSFKISKKAIDTAISISSSNLDLDCGEQAELSAAVLPACLGDTKIDWKSSSSCIEITEAEGSDSKTSTIKVTGKKIGTAKITAYCAAIKKSAVCTVTVDYGKVSFDKEQLSLLKNTTEKLQVLNKDLEPVTGVKLVSSDPSVASVDSDGTVKGVGIGTAAITVSSSDYRLTNPCIVTVSPMDVSFSPETVSLDLYSSKTVKVVPSVEGTSLDDLQFSSSDPGVASVASDGTITGLSAGTATISLVSTDYKAVNTCTVTVSSNMASNVVTLSPNGSDDTEAINDAIDAAYSRSGGNSATIYLSKGNFYVSPRPGIYMMNRENLTIIMDDKTVINSLACSSETGRIFYFRNCNNIKVIGGTLIGDRDTSSDNKELYGIVFSQTNNSSVTGTSISKFKYDGIKIETNNRNPNYCTNIVIDSCHVFENARNNIAVTEGKQVTIRNCILENAHGKDPACCIDIETNTATIGCDDITITGCTIKQTKKSSYGTLGAISVTGKANNVSIDNCTITGNLYSDVGKNVIITNCTVNNKSIDSYTFKENAAWHWDVVK